MGAREAFAKNPEVTVVSSSPGWIELRVATSIAQVQKIGAFVREQLEDLPNQLCEDLSTAVEELLSNSMEHGCHLDHHCTVDLKIIRTPHLLLFQIQDDGPGFSMESAEHAAVNNPPEEPLRHTQRRSELGMRPGGFGILMVSKIADELLYNERGNEVTLVKYLNGL